MPVEMALWRMSVSGPVPLAFEQLDQEKRLEDMVVADPTLTGLELLVLGRQVPTPHGGFLDVLGVDSDARVHVLELKRGKTPREVVAQALDYGSWAQTLSLEAASDIFAANGGDDLAAAFADRFGAPLPDVFNADQQLTIVAGRLDNASERIVGYLSERYGVPVNAVFFRYLKDGDAEYLARTWLHEPNASDAARPRAGGAAKVRPWNGRDFYVVMGSSDHGADRWTTAARYGFVGAGGGEWYSKPLKNLAPGARVFAYVGAAGYVGVGEVIGGLTLLRDLVVEVGGATAKPLDDAGLPEVIRERALDPDPANTEYAVPVRWLATRPANEAIREAGMFASQVTACKLRDDRTVETVLKGLGLDAAT